MRPRWFIVLAGVCLVGCASTPGGPPRASPSEPSASSAVHVTPSKIRRLRADFPAGYEVSDVVGGASPVGYWGLGADWTADPPQCAGLANPVTGDAPPQGLAGSGAGGIVYAVVVASTPPAVLDPVVVGECSRWSMTAGRSTAAVDLTPAPRINGVETVGMATATRTVVEGGTETDSQIRTVTAYLGDYVAFVSVVTDPGSPHPPLPPDFADTLLAKAVATLRG